MFDKTFKEMFENRDLIVFVTAVAIAACDLLSSGFFAIREVVAAPAPVVVITASQAVDAREDVAAQRWAERMARLGAR